MLGDSLRRRHREPGERPPPVARTRGRFGLVHWLGAAVVILLVSFGVGYLLSTQVLFPRPETAGTGIVVPDLSGLERAEAERSLIGAGLESGDVIELENPGVDEGRVLAQDPLPGQQLRRGASVAFAVSRGGARVRIPPLTGLEVIAAQELLERVGLSVELRQTRSTAVRTGAVVGTEPASGEVVPVPGTVTLLVSAGAPADSLAAPDPVPVPDPPGG